MLVSDQARLAPRTLPELARAAARAGVDDIQVREKALGGGALAALVRAVAAAAAGTSARVLVNGRADVALAAGAQGVQLPEDGLDVRAVKESFPEMVVGASRHSADGVRRAAEQGADFAILGPVFATPGKEARALGLAAFEKAVRGAGIPVYAIGGIESGNARAVVDAGASGLALLRPFLQGDPGAIVAEIRGALA